MTMYVPAHFEAPSTEAMLDVIRSSPLATVISVVAGELLVSYIPLTIAAVEPGLVFTGHCARANPHWKHFEDGPVFAIFRGPDGYISPRFYQDCSTNVPSWNYVAVHCTGVASIAAPEATDGILRSLVDQMESSAERPWRIEDLTDANLQRLKKAIVPFSISVSRVTAKFKLSQHGTDGDVAGLIRGLRETRAEKDRLLADAMEGVRPR